jgi:hypothetical protein
LLIASKCELELASLNTTQPLGTVADELDRLERQLSVWDSALRQLAEHAYVQCAEEGQLVEAARCAIGTHARASRKLARRALRQIQALEDVLERDIGNSMRGTTSAWEQLQLAQPPPMASPSRTPRPARAPSRQAGPDRPRVDGSGAPPPGSAVEHFVGSVESGTIEATYPQAVQLLVALLSKFSPGVRARVVRDVDKALLGEAGTDAKAAALRGSPADQAGDAARSMAEALNLLSDAQRNTAINVLFVGLSANATRHLRGYFAEEPPETTDAEVQCEILNRYARWESTGVVPDGLDAAQQRKERVGSALSTGGEATGAAPSLSRAPSAVMSRSPSVLGPPSAVTSRSPSVLGPSLAMMSRPPSVAGAPSEIMSRSPSVAGGASASMSRSPSVAGAPSLRRRRDTTEALRRGSASLPHDNHDAHLDGGAAARRKEQRMSLGGLSSMRESHASGSVSVPIRRDLRHA